MHDRINWRVSPETEHCGAGLRQNYSHHESNGAASAGYGHRLDQKLRLDVCSPRADRFADSDFPRSFRYRGEQDVHDSDTAHREYQSREQSQKQLRQKHRLARVFQALRSDLDIELLDLRSITLGQPIHCLRAERVDGFDAVRLETKRRQSCLTRWFEHRFTSADWSKGGEIRFRTNLGRCENSDDFTSASSHLDRAADHPERIATARELLSEAMAEDDYRRRMHHLARSEESTSEHLD